MAKRLRSRGNALYLVFEIVERLSGHWRALNGGANVMALVLQGCAFKNDMMEGLDRRRGVSVVA